MRRNKDCEALSPLSTRNRNTNEATPTRGCFVVYKEQWALRLLDFDDGDAGAAETDVFVPVVGYAADGVEVLADNGA